MTTEHLSPSDSSQSPMRVSGKLFIIVLIPVIIIAFAWMIYARMNFRGASPPVATSSENRLP